MSDAPKRIHVRWGKSGDTRVSYMEDRFWPPDNSADYILATPAALSDHPAVKALVAEAEALVVERAAAMSCSCGYDVPDNVTFDEAQMFRAGAEAALDAVSAMLRAEAAAIRKGETP